MLQQVVVDDHALGRAQTRDVRVGRGRSTRGVDLVHLAHLHAGLAGEGQDLRAGPSLRQGREAVEDRIEHDRARVQERRPDRDDGDAPRRPPMPGKPALEADEDRPARPGQHPPIASDLATSTAHPPHDCVTRPTSTARWRMTAPSGSVASVRPADSAAPASAAARTGRRKGPRSAGGRSADEQDEHASLDEQAGPVERQLGAAEVAGAVELSGAEVGSGAHGRRIDHALARPKQEHCGLRGHHGGHERDRQSQAPAVHALHRTDAHRRSLRYPRQPPCLRGRTRRRRAPRARRGVVPGRRRRVRSRSRRLL